MKHKTKFSSRLTSQEVISLLEGVLTNEFDSNDWDYFISVKFDNPHLENTRERMQEIWTANSEYMKPGCINPADVNELGREEIKCLIDNLKENFMEA